MCQNVQRVCVTKLHWRFLKTTFHTLTQARSNFTSSINSSYVAASRVFDSKPSIHQSKLQRSLTKLRKWFHEKMPGGNSHSSLKGGWGTTYREPEGTWMACWGWSLLGRTHKQFQFLNYWLLSSWKALTLTMIRNDNRNL